MVDIARLMAKIEAGRTMSAEYSRVADLIIAEVNNDAETPRIVVIDGKKYAVLLKELVNMEEFAGATANFGTAMHDLILKKIKLHEQELEKALSP